jgi:hypothetical protein
MKKIQFILLILVMVSGISNGQEKNPPSGTNYSLLAGISKINITPEKPIPIGWHAGANKVFDGVHDSVFVRVIVFSDGTSKAALISVDGTEFSNEFDDEVFKRIYEKTGIPEQNVILSATNTHAGPTNIYSGRDYTKSTLPEVKAYSDGLKEKIITAVAVADKNLKPASIGIGRGECKMNINRRAPMPPDGYPWLGKNPDGSCDHEVMVCRVDDQSGNPMAVYINWPCQAAVMGPSGNQLTGDWPGATSLLIEKESGNKVVALVSAGASGNIDPLAGPSGTSFGRTSMSSDNYGYVLGREVLRVMKEISSSAYGKISGLRKSITLPGKLSTRDIPGISFDDTKKLKPGTFTPGPSVEIRLSALKIGSVIFTGIAADVFHEIGLKIKALSAYRNTFVVTHCNGWSGYVVTDKAYEEGGYETVSTRIMSGGEKAVLDNLLDLVENL